MAPMLCAALLFQLTYGADVLAASSDGPEQCLMQKKHHLAKSNDLIHVHDQHLEQSAVARDNKYQHGSFTQSSSEELEQSAPKKQSGKKSEKPDKKGEALHKHGERAAKASHDKAQDKSETHEINLVKKQGGNDKLKTTEKGVHHKAKGSKHRHAKAHTKKHGKALLQKGAGAGKASKAHAHKVGASHHRHHKRHHKSHKYKAPTSFGQMNASYVHKRTRSHSPSLDELPKPMLALAWKLFKTEGAILGLLENTMQVDVTHAGVAMTLKMNKHDDATTRLGSEGTWFSYDLDTLGDTRDDSKTKLNMLDVGGNYGVVTIAAMKKYPKRLRVVVVEPIPTTYFFLKWNLHINGIPELEKSALQDKAGFPGVLALNSGSADVAGQDLHFCSYPWSSMNSKVCDCKIGEDNCEVIPSITVDNLAGMFGNEPIAMVKMDCEGCEFKCLPALAQPHLKKRVRRLAGELHIPDKKIETLACGWDNGRLVSKCQHSARNHDDIECGVELACQM